ncbi:MAG: conjugal transfer protein TraG N-terminal domain-containing protein [Proteobacteria bacterium]|nr:conjugal transfer protein TraG N-terminal domain-containing protein [Pseudomonadota bacterium]
MTFTTTDYLEYYLTLVGWIVSNGIWNVLLASGLFAIPFAFIVIQEWLKARTEGVDEGNKGALSSVRIENRVWTAVMVILFGCIPFMPVSLATIQFDRSRSVQCHVNVPLPDSTGWANAYTTLNSQNAMVPAWWFLVHSLSKAVTGAAVAAIPCGVDLRQMRMDIDATRINDPLLVQEVSDFTRDCYGQSRARLFANRPTLTEAQMNDVSWIGSRYFLNTPGFYDTYHASTALDLWPYNPTRDAGLAEVTGGGGYPTCNQWWLDGGRGLRARLLAQVDPDLLTRFAGWAGFLSADEVADSVIRAIASPRQQIVNRGESFTDYGGRQDWSIPHMATRGLADLGIIAQSPTHFPGMDLVRQGLPMVLSFLKMALVICIPLVLLIGLYDLKALMTVSCIQFALFFVDFWFQLARWVDSTIMDALYGWNSPHSNLNPLMGLNNHFADFLLNFVMSAMFIVLPLLWVSALGWVGLQAGGLLQGLSNGTAGARAAGASGWAAAGQIASKITQAVSKSGK